MPYFRKHWGAGKNIPSHASPPDDLCVRHKEWREFFSTGAALPQTKYSNAYDHCNVPCIQSRCPFFTPDLLVIPANIAIQLLPIHTAFLFNTLKLDDSRILFVCLFVCLATIIICFVFSCPKIWLQCSSTPVLQYSSAPVLQYSSPVLQSSAPVQ